jgi:DNA-binding protein Fis
LKKAMSSYLQSIDAEDIQDVYRARFAELDRFEALARRVHDQTIGRSKGDRIIIAKARERLAKDLARFDSSRKECRANMKGKTF